MTLLERELAKLTNAQLRELARHELRELATAAQAELDDRPATKAEELRAVAFPQNPIS